MAHQLGLVAAARRALPGDLADRLSPHATVLRSRGGRLLLNVGAPSTSVHLVLEGRVQVVVCSGHGGEVILRDLAAGDLFGELSAIDGRPRSTSIVALGDCTVASIPGPAFRDAACATPEGALWLARRLTAQVRGLTERILELNTLRVPARLHCELLRLSTDDPETGGRTIDPAPTHADLAARVGTHREAVTRELRWLAGRNILAQHRRRIEITDVPALAKLVREAKGDDRDPLEDAAANDARMLGTTA
ncbi:Crp/Fnr family transcriptional regulator [Sphingomonas lenta]|uniref:Cyclic nucleotide-binding protein n=1 Tax=Sphingomonas lenta TaxID=1141887 RepID=A0A2A2SCR5_9SPHN|nr:Crp/Fnr family transcriptional regulator [Sphingomonas lenta]PAX06995.1 cyclic nucleotide-binding protein [Sphingomonas lenta]